jgi:purine-nucleoside phosphorylase
MMKKLGADVIGMSTVPEAIALNHMGKKVVAVSCITNLAAGVSKSALYHEEVLVVAKKVQKSFGYLVKEFFNAINI